MNDDFLTGVSVLDLGRWYAAPLAARLLGDFGAEVIRVEPPEGDPTRAEGPFPPGFEGHPDHSGVYHYFNGGKLGVTLDAASERGRGLLGDLVARADVVVADRLPAEARALRLTWDDVREGESERGAAFDHAVGARRSLSRLPGLPHERAPRLGGGLRPRQA